MCCEHMQSIYSLISDSPNGITCFKSEMTIKFTLCCIPELIIYSTATTSTRNTANHGLTHAVRVQLLLSQIPRWKVLWATSFVNVQQMDFKSMAIDLITVDIRN